jgi:hypothetical protein
MFQARSSVGKTTWALNVVKNNCPLPTIFFSLEMHARYIAARLAAIHSQVKTETLESELRRQGVSHPMNVMVEDFPHLAIIDRPGMSLKAMQSAVDETVDAWAGVKPALIVIDFLELIGGTMSLSAVDKVDQLCFRLKDFARNNNAVVLILHQVGRGQGGAGAEPLDIMSAKYGGEVSADYLVGAYRPCLRKGITQDQYMAERWWFYMQFLKTRGGSEIHPEGKLHMLNPETLRITEWPHVQQIFLDEGHGAPELDLA